MKVKKHKRFRCVDNDIINLFKLNFSPTATRFFLKHHLLIYKIQKNL